MTLIQDDRYRITAAPVPRFDGREHDRWLVLMRDSHNPYSNTVTYHDTKDAAIAHASHLAALVGYETKVQQ